MELKLESKGYVIEKRTDSHARGVERKLVSNGGYCPCRLKRDETTKCMCEDFRKQLEDPTFIGRCLCGLFEKKPKEG